MGRWDLSDDHRELRFGPHTAVVEEVVEFVLSGGVLRDGFKPLGGEAERFRVIRSLDNVESYREPGAEAKIEGRNWLDLTRIDDRKYPLDAVPNSDEIEALRDRLWPTFEAVWQQMWLALESQLSHIVPYDALGEMSGVFDNLVVTRAMRGVLADTFEERLYSIYRAGGYPCGWEGRYPSGRLVVFTR